MIIHINGWPGVGKYTIGKALAKRINARFIHNHVLHDVAFSCAGYGDEDRWPLYDKVREAAYDVLSRKPANEIFVMTNALCNGHSREEEAWRHVAELAKSRSVTLVPVVLLAETETIAHRICSKERSEMKLKDPDHLREMVTKHTLQVPTSKETFELNVDQLTVEEAIDQICEHLERLGDDSKN